MMIDTAVNCPEVKQIKANLSNIISTRVGFKLCELLTHSWTLYVALGNNPINDALQRLENAGKVFLGSESAGYRVIQDYLMLDDDAKVQIIDHVYEITNKYAEDNNHRIPVGTGPHIKHEMKAIEVQDNKGNTYSLIAGFDGHKLCGKDFSWGHQGFRIYKNNQPCLFYGVGNGEYNRGYIILNEDDAYEDVENVYKELQKKTSREAIESHIHETIKKGFRYTHDISNSQ